MNPGDQASLRLYKKNAGPESGQPNMFRESLEKYKEAVHREKPWKIIDSWTRDRNLTGDSAMAKLFNTAVMYETMASLLQNLTLGKERDVVRSGGREYKPDAVSLMTIHAAKGLEFPVVFICGVNDGRIPLRNNSIDIPLDEERRLFYVGITRARDELSLLTSRTPSPFLADIPLRQLLKESVLTRTRFKQAALFD